VLKTDRGWDIVNKSIVVIGFLATVFSCAVAILAFTAPKTLTEIIVQIAGQPQLVYVTVVVEPTSPPVTNTPRPTNTSTSTPWPTLTSTPLQPTATATPTPLQPTATPTPEPTQTSVPVLSPGESFTEVMSDGLDEEMWSRIVGNYDVVDGALVATEPMQLTFGDADWTDYEIKVKVRQSTWNINLDNVICVRCRDDNAVILEYGGFNWSGTRAPEVLALEDGSMRRLKFYHAQANNMVLTVRVEGNQYTAFAGNNQIISYLIKVESGIIRFNIDKGTKLEWIEITRLN
jgi:hypothetical protein